MITGLLVLLAQALGLISTVHAIMTARTSQGTIAWAVALNTFPYLSVPAYWVLGRSRFQGYVVARRSIDADAGRAVGDVLEPLAEYVIDLPGDNGAGLAAVRLADLPFLRDNSVELLIDGNATFESILAGMESAREYILMQFFIVHDDEIGRRVQQALIRKAGEGVRVRFLYDEVGCHRLPNAYIEELRAAGVEVSAFGTRRGRGNRFQINFRNHRKVVVVDGATAWIGGHNVGDEYLGRDPKFGRWRDTHVRIDGPAALAAQLSFAEDWFWATGSADGFTWKPRPAGAGNAPVLIVASGPADELETASLMFVHAINSARERIWISSPYFVPDEAVMAALQLAGMRGVDVRILIPSRPDHILVYLAAFSYFDEAGLTGVQFYRFNDGFLHSKAMLVDREAAAVGTANFDNRSFRLNFEITAIVADPIFIEEVEAMFLDDFSKSRKVTGSEYRDRPFWFRFASRLARLTSPIL